MRSTAPDLRTLCGALLMALCALSGCSPSRDAAPVARASAAPAQAAAAAVARGKIEVEGGLLDLAPETGGIVGQLFVKEGEAVAKGQVLLRLADGDLRGELNVAQSELLLAQARSKAKADRLPALTQTAGRWRAAVRAGAADQQSLDEADQALRAAQAEATVAGAEVSVAQRKRDQIQARIARMELRSPEAGTVVRMNAHQGAALAAGAAVVLLPDLPLQVRAELNESFVDAVREGMAATVVADTDAGEAAPLPAARVVRISRIVGVARLQDDQLRGPVRVVECVLAFEQPPKGARVGQNVRVTFHD